MASNSSSKQAQEDLERILNEALLAIEPTVAVPQFETMHVLEEKLVNSPVQVDQVIVEVAGRVDTDPQTLLLLLERFLKGGGSSMSSESAEALLQRFASVLELEEVTTATLGIEELDPVSPSPDGLLPFHTAIWKGTLDEQWEDLVASGADVNAKDVYGNTPLHLAVFMASLPAMKRLLTHEHIQTNRRNSAGWTPTDEAVAIGSRHMVETIYDHQQVYEEAVWTKHLPEVFHVLSLAPDFEVEMAWEVNSPVLRFVKTMAPSDTYKVYKSSSTPGKIGVRLDYTLGGVDNGKVVRGEQSLVFRQQSENSARLCVVNHTKKTTFEVCNFLERTLPGTRELYIDDIMAWDGGDGYLEFDNTTFGRKTSTNAEPTMVAGYPTVVFEASSTVKGVMKTRTLNVSDNTTLVYQQLQQYSETYGESHAPLPVVAKPKTKAAKIKTLSFKKKMKATIWMCEEGFPLCLADLVPILDMMLQRPKNQMTTAVEKVKKILTAPNFPSKGFPIQIRVPLIASIYVNVSFLNLKLNTPMPSFVFDIPSNYREKPPFQA